MVRIRGLPGNLTAQPIDPWVTARAGHHKRVLGGQRPLIIVEPSTEAGMVWSMTSGDAAVLEGTDPRARAFGYAQRRIWVFWAWWYGAVHFITGAADGTLSAILGQDPERGIFMMVLGTALITLTPNGRSPGSLPIVGLVTALLTSITGGMAYSASVLRNSGELYARWLERR